MTTATPAPGAGTRPDPLDDLRQELDSPVFEAPKLMREMVARGQLGKKSGKGFYDWS